MAPSSALPIGAQRAISETQPVLIDPAQPGSGLLNAVLALLSPYHSDENERYDEEVLDLDIVGFLVVCGPAYPFFHDIGTGLIEGICRTGLDIPGRKMTILAPGPGGVTGRVALIGSFEW